MATVTTSIVNKPPRYKCTLCSRNYSFTALTPYPSGNGKYDVLVCFTCLKEYENV